MVAEGASRPARTEAHPWHEARSTSGSHHGTDRGRPGAGFTIEFDARTAWDFIVSLGLGDAAETT